MALTFVQPHMAERVSWTDDESDVGFPPTRRNRKKRGRRRGRGPCNVADSTQMDASVGTPTTRKTRRAKRSRPDNNHTRDFILDRIALPKVDDFVCDSGSLRYELIVDVGKTFIHLKVVGSTKPQRSSSAPAHRLADEALSLANGPCRQLFADYVARLRD